MRLFLVLSFFCLVGLAVGETEYWCPLGNEENPNCVAEPERFKCAMAYKNLNYGAETETEKVKTMDIEGDMYTFFAGVPDVLLEAKASGNDARYNKLVKSLSNTTEDSYILKVGTTSAAEVCKDDTLAQRTAAARCVAQFWRAAQRTKLDTCDTNALNEDGKSTIGGNLCRKANKFTGNANQNFVELQVLVSACGKPWKIVLSGKTPFQVDEKLCCESDPDHKSKNAFFWTCGGNATLGIEERKNLTNLNRKRCSNKAQKNN